MNLIGIIIDLLLVLVTVMQIIRYTKDGFVKSFLTLLQSIVSFILAVVFSRRLGEFISDNLYTPEIVSNIFAFIIIYVASFVVFAVLIFMIDKCFKLPVLNQINKVLGFVLGAILSVFNLILLCSIATYILDIFQISPESVCDFSIIYRLLSKLDIISYLIY